MLQSTDGNPSGAGEPSTWLQAPAPAPEATSALQHESELFSPLCTLDEPIQETVMRDVRAVWAKLKVVLLPMDRVVSPFQQYMAVSMTSTSVPTGEEDAAAAANNNGAAAAAAVPAATTPGTTNNNNSDVTEHDRKVIQSLKDWDLWGPLVLCLALAVLLSLRAPTNQASLVFAAVFCSVWAGGTVVTVNAQLLGGTISFFQSLCVMGYSMFPLVISAVVIVVIKIISDNFVTLLIEFFIVLVGFLWSSRVSAVFLSLYIKPERRFLALYPVFFFYTFLGWLILVF
mmetsp:Transcript_22606/g.49347  ORF Transcript_22606/g.49347 Transcript_22606/m.49347 type:complete len:286 (-) Transcript_22606:239-1096(-)